MNRRTFLGSAAVVPAGFSSRLRSAAHSENRDAVRGSGTPIYERYRLTLERVLHGTSPAYNEEFLLADVRPTPERRFTEYSGDLSGRYIGALATAAKVYRTSFPELDRLVPKVLELQKPDGYFGSAFHFDKPDDDDLALLWGNGRLLVGLLEYHSYQAESTVLNACERLGAFLLRIAPLMLSKSVRDEFGAAHFASSYICWTQQTEGLADLFSVTGDRRYRLLAQQIAAVIERRPGDHVHGYLTSLRGLMKLYQATSDARLLQQCEAAWQEVVLSGDLLDTGGVPEGWTPNRHRTEGCAEVDWIRLSLALWKATRKPKYLSMAERATFNELAINQFATGDFGHRLLTETGISDAGAVRAWWCCTLHGLRCFPDIQASAFRREAERLYYDLPIDCAANRGDLQSASLSAVATSSLAENGRVNIVITTAPEAPMSLCLRKPDWADKLVIQVNGAEAVFPVEGGYVRVVRSWQRGDVVTVAYGMSLRSDPVDQKRWTFTFGPWLLGVPAADNETYFNELTTQNKIEPETLQPSANSLSRPFTVPIAATTFSYKPAEFPSQHETVTLRAVAEQTGEPVTRWETRLLTEGPFVKVPLG